MMSDDLYEFTVDWPSTSAQSVIVTGDFDQWSKSLRLTRSSTNNNFFTATIKVPYGCPTRYKFIVDGKWAVKADQPTETTPEGFVNNVYYVPLKPPPMTKPSVNGKVANGNGTAGQPLGMSDLKDTIVASAGTSSALGYVTSGIGGVMRTVVGVDPFNANQIAIPSPITPSASSGLPASIPFGTSIATPATGDAIQESVGANVSDPATTSSESTAPVGSPVAPIVPITIVPVYCKENCTIDPKKVISEEESIGRFVGVRPVKGEDKQGIEGDKAKTDNKTDGEPTVVPSSPTRSGEPAKSTTPEVSKEEKLVVETTAPNEEGVGASAVPEATPVAVADPKAEKTSLEKAPQKVEELPAPTLTGAPTSAPPTTPGGESTTNGHAQVPSSDSAKVPSSRPTSSTVVPVAAGSVTSTPTSTVRRSKIFPQLGNGSPSKTSKAGSVDDFGVKDGKGTTSSKKKRTSSFFGSLKKIFHHETDKEKKEKVAH